MFVPAISVRSVGAGAWVPLAVASTVVMSLLLWGDRYLAPDGPPMLPVHRNCGGRLTAQLTCTDCGASLAYGDVELAPGPGAKGSIASEK